MKETALLEGIGMTKGEIKVYYSLLELGSSTTGEIIKKAKVSRSKVYEMLDKLLEKGLVSFVVKENIKYFEAADPNAILDYIQEKKNSLTEKENSLKRILPTLVKKQKTSKQRQFTTVYDGYKGIKTVFNNILNSLHKGDEYYAFAVGKENYTKEFSTFIKNYHRKREEKGIKVKLLSHKSIKKRLLKELGDYKHKELKFTNEKSPTATLVFGSKVFIFTWKIPTAILIQSKEIANQYKQFFLDIWKRAKD